jgi:adenylate cyclase class 2
LTAIFSIIMKATPRSNHETEIKLRLPDASSARRLLLDHGFRLLTRRVFEQNTVFDTPALRLRKGSCLLRVRRAGKAVTLTYKGPPVPGRHKSREELETALGDADTFAAVLERLGFGPVWRYEKYRTEYRYGAGIATVDETPVGVYIELEGPAEWIDRTARRLGFSEADYIQASYAALYLDWCREHGQAPAHMVFDKPPAA